MAIFRCSGRGLPRLMRGNPLPEKRKAGYGVALTQGGGLRLRRATAAQVGGLALGYYQAAPQQPAKGAQFVGASPTRRIWRFTTERPGACPAVRLEGIEQSWQRTDGPK